MWLRLPHWPLLSARMVAVVEGAWQEGALVPSEQLASE